jgi:hypothetical protein
MEEGKGKQTDLVFVPLCSCVGVYRGETDTYKENASLYPEVGSSGFLKNVDSHRPPLLSEVLAL